MCQAPSSSPSPPTTTTVSLGGKVVACRSWNGWLLFLFFSLSFPPLLLQPPGSRRSCIERRETCETQSREEREMRQQRPENKGSQAQQCVHRHGMGESGVRSMLGKGVSGRVGWHAAWGDRRRRLNCGWHTGRQAWHGKWLPGPTGVEGGRWGNGDTR